MEADLIRSRSVNAGDQLADFFKRHQVAFIRLRAERHREAKQEFDELLSEHLQVVDPHDEMIHVIRHNIASCRRGLGDNEGALSDFQEFWRIAPDILGNWKTTPSSPGSSSPICLRNSGEPTKH
jgi:hypothetical protein